MSLDVKPCQNLWWTTTLGSEEETERLTRWRVSLKQKWEIAAYLSLLSIVALSNRFSHHVNEEEFWWFSDWLLYRQHIYEEFISVLCSEWVLPRLSKLGSRDSSAEFISVLRLCWKSFWSLLQVERLLLVLAGSWKIASVSCRKFKDCFWFLLEVGRF